MILGMSESTFTLVHVAISLVGIVAGLVVMAGFLSSRLSGWTGLFLATTILTDVTGYFFPRDRILPSHIVGAISLVILAIAVLALYRYRLTGAWRWIYVVTAVASLATTSIALPIRISNAKLGSARVSSSTML